MTRWFKTTHLGRGDMNMMTERSLLLLVCLATVASGLIAFA